MDETQVKLVSTPLKLVFEFHIFFSGVTKTPLGLQTALALILHKQCTSTMKLCSGGGSDLILLTFEQGGT